jgi:hypothetical protein
MGMLNKNWKPSWWKDETHLSGWDRVREAMKRDWTQTKKDLHVGGHELNQDVKDTVKQMAGKEPIPGTEQVNRGKVIGSFDDAEIPMQYGYGARKQFGSDRFSSVEQNVRSDWESTNKDNKWDDVRDYVRRGYEYDRTSIT